MVMSYDEVRELGYRCSDAHLSTMGVKQRGAFLLELLQYELSYAEGICEGCLDYMGISQQLNKEDRMSTYVKPYKPIRFVVWVINIHEQIVDSYETDAYDAEGAEDDIFYTTFSHDNVVRVTMSESKDDVFSVFFGPSSELIDGTHPHSNRTSYMSWCDDQGNPHDYFMVTFPVP